MTIIENQTFDQERALYGSVDLTTKNCRFDGPADGESAFKECRNIEVADCFFNLRYPFWHDTGLRLTGSELTPLCRAALWYTEDAVIEDSQLHGIKALRECAKITMRRCDVDSAEFGWSVRGMEMADCTVKGEYLGWYSEDLTLIGCKISGTQPLCYCKGLRLVDCEMIDTDLSFERSEVEATLTAPILSIKNPRAGRIRVPHADEIIIDDPLARGIVLQEN